MSLGITGSAHAPLRTVRDLGRAGVADEYIQGWLRHFQRDVGDIQSDVPLTDLQVLVANDPEAAALRGNLIVAGPTSAGKTLAAEIQMARMLTRATSPDGCIYAVPLRALATEKFEHFKRLFGEQDVYVSSGDYQDQDSLILNRRFKVAVVVYEKLFGWLLKRNARNSLLQKTGLLIVDEVQMLGNIERGARLELLLTFVLRMQQQTERAMTVMGLGPSSQALSRISEWLRARMICATDEKRPVPLVEGCACADGIVWVDSMDERVRSLPPGRLPSVIARQPRLEDMLQSLVRDCMGPGGEAEGVGARQRLLVYCPTKDGVEKTAGNVARALGNRQTFSRGLVKRMKSMERTHALARLSETLLCGVGFHHGDLTFAERLLVEEMFRAPAGGECIDVLCCTSTLGMGVNLPADMVVFTSPDSYKARTWDTRVNLRDRMSPLEYRNFAGRAGRLRQSMAIGHLGISLFLSERKKKEAQREIIDGIINKKIEPVVSELVNWPFGLEPLVLAAAECASAESRGPAGEGVLNVFDCTFASYCSANSRPPGRPRLDERVQLVMTALKGDDLQLVDPDWSVRGAGHVVARAGIHIDTFRKLRSLVMRIADERILEKPLVILEELAGAPEIARLWPTSMPDSLRQQSDIARGLHDFFSELHREGIELGPLAIGEVSTPSVPSVTTLERLMRVAAMHLWMQGRTAIEISGKSMLKDLRYGACKQLADQFAWLVSGMPDLWESLGLSVRCSMIEAAECRWAMERLERCLNSGVPDDVVSVAQLKVPGVHRENLMELWRRIATIRDRKRAWDHPVDLLGLSNIDLGKEWKPMLTQIKDAIRSRSWRDDPRPRDTRQQHDAMYACERDGNHRVDIAQALCVENLWKWPGSRVIEAAAESLRLRPFTANVRDSTRDGERRYFIHHEGKCTELAYLHVPDSGYGEESAARDLFSLLARPLPNGKPLDGLLVVIDGNVEAIRSAVKTYGRPITVINRVALGYLVTRCLLEPESIQDLAGTEEMPLPQRVVQRLAGCAGPVIIASEQDATAHVLDGCDHRGRGPISGELMGHASASNATADSSPIVTPTNENHIREIGREVDKFSGQDIAFVQELQKSLRGVLAEIYENPASAVARIRNQAENLTKQALTILVGTKDSDIRRWDTHRQINELKASRAMGQVWGTRLEYLHKQSNSAHHTDDIADHTGHFQVKSFSVDDAVDFARQIVMLWTEFLDRRWAFEEEKLPDEVSRAT